MLELEDVVVGLHLLASFLGCQTGLAGFLLAHEGGATGRLGDADAGHSRFLHGVVVLCCVVFGRRVASCCRLRWWQCCATRFGHEGLFVCVSIVVCIQFHLAALLSARSSGPHEPLICRHLFLVRCRRRH